MSTTAILVVDVQVDFCEGGALPVEGGNKVAENIGAYVKDAHDHPEDTVVIFSRDWHKPESDNGGHFADDPDFKDTWPAHCVQGTDGANFAEGLGLSPSYGTHVIKGMDKPAYSAFEGVLEQDGTTSLGDYLRMTNVEEVLVCGLAADYCVRATALDAVKEGFSTTLLADLTASITTPISKVNKEIEDAQKVAE